jgi:putative ABC transport system permease protein
MRLVAGRDLALSDDATQEPVALVNEEFVRRYLGGRDPLNLHFGFWAGRARIVGVVRNAPFRRLGEPVAPGAYLTYRQFPQHGLNLVVKSDNPPAFLRSEIDRIAARLEPATSPVASMQLEDYIGPAFAIPRVSAAMMSALGVVALILATLGTYAVLAQCAAQREREFGVRLALGAAPHAVARLILGQGCRLLAAGLLLGALGAAVVGRVLGSILVGVRPWDLASWLTVATVLSAAVLVACWLPARRAARIDPVVALRCE